MANPPLVAAVLHSDQDDVHYQLKCAAYGLEMQIDDEWNAELVLLAPHAYLDAITEETDVTGEDTAIVSAGVSDLPVDTTGQADLTVISHDKNNWLLLGIPAREEPDEAINANLRAALAAGCRVILCISDLSTGQLEARVDGVPTADLSRMVISYVEKGSIAPGAARRTAREVRDRLVEIHGTAGNAGFILAGNITAENALGLVSLAEVDGVLLLDDQYEGWGTLLGILQTVGV